MAEELKWSLQDTFNNWLIKYNQSQDYLDELNANIEDLGFEFREAEFTYVPATGDSLSVTIRSGRVRYSSEVQTVPDTTLTLLANKNYVVGLLRVEGMSSIQAFEVTATPDEMFLPLYRFVTNASTIQSSFDLRTRFAYDVGTSGGDEEENNGGVLQIDRFITKDIAVKVNKNAMSISPVVTEGVTVTVGEGSVWVVL